jgi:molybdate transport system substrate-binding protein
MSIRRQERTFEAPERIHCHLPTAFPPAVLFGRNDPSNFVIDEGFVMFSIATRPGVGVSEHLVALLVYALALLLTATPASAGEIRVFSGGAPQEALRAVTPEFEKATGHRVHFTFALVTVIQQKLAGGEKADLIFLPVPLISATEKSLALRSEGRIVLVRVGIGVIVRKGAALPDISTSDAVRKVLLDARSIAFPDPNTPSGAHLARMIGQLGIAVVVRPKLVIKAAIDGGAELVAKGEADVGMYLLSEVQSAKAITVVGPLPPALQSFVVYGSAIPAYNGMPEPAVAFVKFVSAPGKKTFWKAAGFELMGAGN